MAKPVIGCKALFENSMSMLITPLRRVNVPFISRPLPFWAESQFCLGGAKVAVPTDDAMFRPEKMSARPPMLVLENTGSGDGALIEANCAFCTVSGWLEPIIKLSKPSPKRSNAAD
ncbi:hypothetical protein BpHYR1_050147 [Brachionus plicatilis]|uniref:Uncharacterized protein n=1 Tax=Brachionus plicatilis TaxID=10195 RepID=A0A3M7QYS3_BRAPC|nr:hypothetical protein BpHYR1_050147 [Brachionus plicatilis]